MDNKTLSKLQKLEQITGAQQAEVSRRLNDPKSFLNIMWAETLQDEKEMRQALAFYVGYLAYGMKLKDWPREVNPDKWLENKKIFAKYFRNPDFVHPETLEMYLRDIANEHNFSGAHSLDDCWNEFFPKCPFPELPTITRESEETAIEVQPHPLTVPLTNAPGF